MILLPTLFIIFTQFYVPHVSNQTDTNTSGYLFTIHGMWPEYSNNTYPAYCNKSIPFNVSVLGDLIPRLNIAWVSYEGSNTHFWAHEFEKHGTCFPEPDEYHFFDSGIAAWVSYNTTYLFQKSGLEVGQNYSYQNVSKSLNNALLQCEKDDNGNQTINKSKHHKLEQVWYCMTLDFQPFVCPSWLASNCYDQIKL